MLYLVEFEFEQDLKTLEDVRIETIKGKSSMKLIKQLVRESDDNYNDIVIKRYDNTWDKKFPETYIVKFLLDNSLYVITKSYKCLCHILTNKDYFIQFKTNIINKKKEEEQW